MSGSYRVTQIKEILDNVGILLNNQHGHGFTKRVTHGLHKTSLKEGGQTRFKQGLKQLLDKCFLLWARSRVQVLESWGRL